MLAKKAIKTQKRWEQTQEKREEDKKITVDHLLKKQDSKVGKNSRLKSSKKEIYMFSYVNNRDMVGLSVPASYSFPMEVQGERGVPAARLCGAPGCRNPRRYSCSRTGVSLCSLQCYKVNLAAHKMLQEAA
ncbi:INO80 complex subunit B [Chionoecetes opilio]|uniref:INO80 complex subunit B n=1 Tax=Chionoecetes opilio TaxID=41210 RepID=A0A8J4XT12_CHIOP|nr:INO80 complex subunit B [Chionoecetes opilio]